MIYLHTDAVLPIAPRHNSHIVRSLKIPAHLAPRELRNQSRLLDVSTECVLAFQWENLRSDQGQEPRNKGHSIWHSWRETFRVADVYSSCE